MSTVDTAAIRRLMDRLRSGDPVEAEAAIGHLIDWADVGVFERAADEIDRLRTEQAVARGRVEFMRECAEACLDHLEGLHRVPAARAIRAADHALAELAVQP